jgi:hypothetical protein
MKQLFNIYDNSKSQSSDKQAVAEELSLEEAIEWICNVEGIVVRVLPLANAVEGTFVGWIGVVIRENTSIVGTEVLSAAALNSIDARGQFSRYLLENLRLIDPHNHWACEERRVPDASQRTIASRVEWYREDTQKWGKQDD